MQDYVDHTHQRADEPTAPLWPNRAPGALGCAPRRNLEFFENPARLSKFGRQFLGDREVGETRVSSSGQAIAGPLPSQSPHAGGWMVPAVRVGFIGLGRAAQ